MNSGHRARTQRRALALCACLALAAFTACAVASNQPTITVEESPGGMRYLINESSGGDDGPEVSIDGVWIVDETSRCLAVDTGGEGGVVGIVLPRGTTVAASANGDTEAVVIPDAEPSPVGGRVHAANMSGGYREDLPESAPSDAWETCRFDTHFVVN